MLDDFIREGMIISTIRKLLYNKLVYYHSWKYRRLYGMDIGVGTLISRKANLDRAVFPKGIHIGEYSHITGGVVVLTHDACRDKKADTFIGDNCFIGIRSIILPGVHIGNQVVIAAGSIVTKNIPDNCIAAGNPARVIKSNIQCGPLGVILPSK